ncbi:MAG: InlB B-repeat-containing protein [Clostridiales Family XIII bacterium]|nr:InlB B-repeat-containing protein [Clostridiales Family XIII bacterium]
MKAYRKLIASLLILSLAVTPVLPFYSIEAQAKTASSSKADNVFFYVRNNEGKDVLLSVLPLGGLSANEYAQYTQNNYATQRNYRYSAIDNLPVTTYTEATGLTLEQFLYMAKERAPLLTGKSALSYSGSDSMRFMATDSGGSYTKSWTYDQLYGTDRYYFPGIYDAVFGWDASWGSTSAAAVADKDKVWATKADMVPILGFRTFSGRYSARVPAAGGENMTLSPGQTGGTDDEQDAGRFTDENALTLLIPQTKEDLYNANRTMSDNFKWIYNIRLDMAPLPALIPSGEVAMPTISFSPGKDADTLSVSLSCTTEGADIYYYDISAVTGENGGDAPVTKYKAPVIINVAGRDLQKSPVRFTYRAVKPGYTDAGILKAQYPSQAPALVSPPPSPAGTDISFKAKASVTQQDWNNWAASLTAVSVKAPGASAYRALTPGSGYTVNNSSKSVTIKKTLFTAAGWYDFKFASDGYAARLADVQIEKAADPPGTGDNAPGDKTTDAGKGSGLSASGVKAKVTSKTYTIRLNVNRGKALKKAKRIKKVKFGKKYGAFPKPVRKGYIFKGWYTKKKGGTKITAGKKVKITANKTYYAHWKKKKKK